MRNSLEKDVYKVKENVIFNYIFIKMICIWDNVEKYGKTCMWEKYIKM
jgi:hypothetical protein